MKHLVALALLIGLGTASELEFLPGHAKVNDFDHIHRLNVIGEREDALWTAGSSTFFGDMTFDGARLLLGSRLSHISNHRDVMLNRSNSDFHIEDNELPKFFDSTITWKGRIHPIRDQQRCGSGWAMSASEVLSDRFAIASGKPYQLLSTEELLVCSEQSGGCQGGEASDAWKYLTGTGLATESCLPYFAGGSEASGCSSQCVNPVDAFVRVRAYRSLAIKGPKDMQKELLTHGPIQVGFHVYRSFLVYRRGVYHKLKAEMEPEGGHSARITGWGMDGGKQFWTVANSWSTDWGEDGYFRILRGKDECGIESMGPPFAGLPKVDGDDEPEVVI